MQKNRFSGERTIGSYCGSLIFASPWSDSMIVDRRQ